MTLSPSIFPTIQNVSHKIVEQIKTNFFFAK